MKTFVDNIPIQVIQAQILADLPSVFEPKHVLSMDKKVLAKIAGESPKKQKLREELEFKLDTLKKGFETCNQYVRRIGSGMCRF